MNFDPLRLWARNRVVFYAAVLMLPTGKSGVRRLMRNELDLWVPVGMKRGWNAPTTAVIVVSFAVAGAISEIDALDRERTAEQVRTLAPDSLVSEMHWLQDIAQEPKAHAMSPMAFRITFVGATLTSWLVREKTIDIFAKAVFGAAVANALVNADMDKSVSEISALIDRIGSVNAVS